MLLKANENVYRLLRVVLGRRNRGLNSSFIVRKISSGIGVERTFQLFSPLISKIEVIRRRCASIKLFARKIRKVGQDQRKLLVN